VRASRPKREAAESPTGNVETGQLVVPFNRVIIWGFSAISITAASVFAYTSVIGRIDKIDDRMNQQGRSLESLVHSIAKIANEALVPQDLQTFCLKTQLSNSGWKCPPPYGTDGPIPEVKGRPTPVLPRPPSSKSTEKAKEATSAFWPFTN
jgi:hypothetical protein